MKVKQGFIFFIAWFAISTFAADDFYQFNNAQDKARFYQLTTELRCLVCQNQNLAESNAGLATDLRNQIYQKIQNGDSNKEIVDYLVARYGNYILYNPPLNMATGILWFTPLLVMVFGIVYLIRYIRARKSHV